jgi:hypothetical protein
MKEMLLSKKAKIRKQKKIGIQSSSRIPIEIDVSGDALVLQLTFKQS